MLQAVTGVQKVPMAPRSTKRRTHVYGRIWLRATPEEWDAILSTAKREGRTYSDWIMAQLVPEARQERASGHYSETKGFRRNRSVEGVNLYDEEIAPKRNIFCDPTDQQLIQGVANFHSKSVNAWAMRVLMAAVKENELRSLRQQNLIVAENQPRITPEIAKQILEGRPPKWFRDMAKSKKKN